MADDASVTTKIQTELTWLQKHEKLVLVPLLAIALWAVIGKIDTVIANHDAADLHKAEVTANIQADWNKKQSEIVAQQAADYKALADRVTAQNQQLEQANVALASALSKQQRKDAELPPSELAQRWNALVPTASAAVTPSGIGVPQSGAVATVQELEKVPVQQKELANVTGELANTQIQLNASEGQVETLTNLTDGLRLQIKDDAKVCSDKVSVVKAEARKGKRKWFLIGFGAGFVARQIVKTYIGF